MQTVIVPNLYKGGGNLGYMSNNAFHALLYAVVKPKSTVAMIKYCELIDYKAVQQQLGIVEKPMVSRSCVWER